MDYKKYLNEDQDPKAVEKILSKVSELLTREEEVQYIAVQKKPALNFSPDAVVLTNKRVVICQPKNMGLSWKFKDYLWKEVRDCHIDEGILGAKFTVKLIDKRYNFVDYLPKSQARQLYRFAQEMEEEMAEYRRQRKLEESKASAGGVYVQHSSSTPEANVKDTEDPMETLKKLKAMLENDLISQEEFDAKKADILKKL